MHADYLLDRVPVLLFLIAFAMLVLLPIEVGQRLGAHRRRKTDHEPEAPVGNVAGATLALLAFMTALMVGAAISRVDNRKG